MKFLISSLFDSSLVPRSLTDFVMTSSFFLSSFGRSAILTLWASFQALNSAIMLSMDFILASTCVFRPDSAFSTAALISLLSRVFDWSSDITTFMSAMVFSESASLLVSIL